MALEMRENLSLAKSRCSAPKAAAGVACPSMGSSTMSICILGRSAYLYNRRSDRDRSALHCIELVGEASRLLHLQATLGLYQGRRRSKIGFGPRRLRYQLPRTYSWALRPDRGGLLWQQNHLIHCADNTESMLQMLFSLEMLDHQYTT